MKRFRQWSPNQKRFVWGHGDLDPVKNQVQEKLTTHENPRYVNKTPDRLQNELPTIQDRAEAEREGKRNIQQRLHTEAHEQWKAGGYKTDHRAAIAQYKASQSYDLNRVLRSGRKETHRLDKPMSEITSNKTKHGFVAYRGFEHDDNHPVLQSKPGTIYHDKGYTSTTVHLSKAHEFANVYGQKKHIAAIHIPPGTAGHYIEAHNDEQHEGEFVLHKGTKFRITGHSYNPEHEVHFTHMTVHDQD